jgi:hypothetical protein
MVEGVLMMAGVASSERIAPFIIIKGVNVTGPARRLFTK